MERLTTRHGGVAVIKDKSKHKEAMEKLAYYEDLAEQGRLLELPCGEGDEVWKISTQHDNYDDYEYKIILRTSFRLDMVNCIGKTVFLTEQEAQAALEKMKGE